MKLNEFIKVLNDVDVLVLDDLNGQIIYKGRSSGIKRNPKCLKTMI